LGNSSKGMLLIIIGCLVLFFVGGYLCLYSGIYQVINGFQADPVSAGTVAGGVARILFAFLVAFCSSVVIIIGILMRELRRER